MTLITQEQAEAAKARAADKRAIALGRIPQPRYDRLREAIAAKLKATAQNGPIQILP